MEGTSNLLVPGIPLYRINNKLIIDGVRIENSSL